MIGGHMRKRRVFLSLALAWVVFLPITTSASQQNDPFYLRLLDKAQKSFLAKNYWDAAQDFEIAAFGLGQDIILRAKAYFFLGISHYYLNNISKCESFLRQGAELLGDRSPAVLGLPESVLPDLEKLLTFFDIQLAQPTPPTDPPVPQEKDKQEKSSGTPPKIGQENPKPNKKEAANIDQKDPNSESPITLDKIKEGDIIALDMLDTLPMATRRIPAIYPSSASGSRITGTVIVNALISEKGSVVKTEIIQGIKGAVGFDQAAVQAVRRWKFEPATIKGIKVKVWMPISIVFKKPE
jgi:protein TonB